MKRVEKQAIFLTITAIFLITLIINIFAQAPILVGNPYPIGPQTTPEDPFATDESFDPDPRTWEEDDYSSRIANLGQSIPGRTDTQWKQDLQKFREGWLDLTPKQRAEIYKNSPKTSLWRILGPLDPVVPGEVDPPIEPAIYKSLIESLETLDEPDSDIRKNQEIYRLWDEFLGKDYDGEKQLTDADRERVTLERNRLLGALEAKEKQDLVSHVLKESNPNLHSITIEFPAGNPPITYDINSNKKGEFIIADPSGKMHTVKEQIVGEGVESKVKIRIVSLNQNVNGEPQEYGLFHHIGEQEDNIYTRGRDQYVTIERVGDRDLAVLHHKDKNGNDVKIFVKPSSKDSSSVSGVTWVEDGKVHLAADAHWGLNTNEGAGMMIGVKDHNGEMIWMFPNEGSSSYESVYSDNEAYKGDQRRYAGFDIEVKDGKTIITSEKLVNIQKQGEGNFGLAAKGRIALVDNNPDPDADVIIDSIQGKAWINNPENVGINAPNYDFVDNQEYFTRKQEATHKTESGEELVGAGDDTSRTSESAQRVLDGTVEQRQTARESVQQPTSTARGIKKAVTQTDTGTRTTTAGSSNSNINNALDAGEHLLQLQTHRNIKPLTSIQDENYYYFEADGYTYAIEREALDSVTSARGGSTTATTNGAVLYNKQIREFQGTVYRKEGGEWVQRSQANEDGIQTLNQRQGVVQNLYVGTFDDSVVDFYRKTSAQTVIEPESNAPSIKPSSFWINQREYNRNNWEWQGSYYYDNTNREYLRYRSGRLQIYDQTGESWIDRQDDRSYFNPSLDNRPQRDDDSGSGGGSGSSRNNPIS